MSGSYQTDMSWPQDLMTPVPPPIQHHQQVITRIRVKLTFSESVLIIESLLAREQVKIKGFECNMPLHTLISLYFQTTQTSNHETPLPIMPTPELPLTSRTAPVGMDGQMLPPL